jgi:N-acetylglucosamine-6-sulfatase
MGFHRAALAALLVALALAGAAAAEPNVVLIVTDDQRIGTLGRDRTPAIWELVRKQGVLYTNANVPTSVCCPSRASILTGLYSHSHGVYGNDGPFGGWSTFYANGMEERTLALALQNAGYRTGLFGKYLNGGPPFEGHVPPGWDVFEEVRGGYWIGDPPAYSTDVLRDRALAFIRSTPAAQPLFLYLATVAPHAGSIPAPRHENAWSAALPQRTSAFTDAMNDKPPWLRGRRITSEARYAGVLRRRIETMMAVDEAVAAVVAELEAAGRMDDTLLVFLSDNGVLLGEHRVYGKKNFPYRMATQVPMLARWDGHLTAGATDRRLVLNVDVAPTIAAAADVSMETEGLNLLRHAGRPGFPLEAMEWGHGGGLHVPSFCGYRTRRHMYAAYASGFEELYDYRRDRHELNNVAGRVGYRAATRSMRARAGAACNPTPPGFSWRLVILGFA